MTVSSSPSTIKMRQHTLPMECCFIMTVSLMVLSYQSSSTDSEKEYQVYSIHMCTVCNNHSRMYANLTFLQHFIRNLSTWS